MFHKFIVDEYDSNTRIDAYLSNLLSGISRTKIQSSIKNNDILLNNSPCKSSQILKTDDIITANLNTQDKIELTPENIDLDIIYETDNYLVVNKPSGMLTHPTTTQKEHTLVNALLYKYSTLSNLNGELRAGIIHRLDKNTSGLLIIAKNNIAHEKFGEMIQKRQVEKHYRAIVKGVLQNNVVIDTPIGRSKTNPTKMAVREDGKSSITEVSIIKQYQNATYVDINLKTGRTHQIRVHLSSIGHPVFNDSLYGFGKSKVKTEEQVLQSYKLKFKDPFNSENVELQIPPDEKITKVLKFLDANNQGE